MTLQECYAALGGDFDDVISRLRSERLVQKFVLMFLKDNSYEQLLEHLAADNYDDAFRDAHTIKGMCQNLSFTDLAHSSSELTEALRGGRKADDALVEAAKADYEKTAAAIRTFAAGLG